MTVNYQLRDGFFKTGFDWEKSQDYCSHRVTNGKCGWLLHLHGSPHYYTKKDICKKFKRSDVPTKNDGLTPHVVLTHKKFKMDLIRTSKILNAYWEMFESLLPHNKNIILFGMSGEDDHINDAIKKYSSDDAKVRIVEWNGEKQDDELEQFKEDREKYWFRKLGDKFKKENLVLFGNIQDFEDWAIPHQ